ncbi:DUF2236 domain-containing protein [Marinilongibacter aquaticus]|uniref:DUF2236 domain-containing protein n=1 Tax=Marinilongibacter aquaticus TaxID=2975157 RepID=UPI0021BD44FB|nr:DUF2236 domain-containing protein [Marinilongibacter aquaticus]UBM58022.1 DUF2236 domain-containing protein [Marinilongibacter aquaticus]
MKRPEQKGIVQEVWGDPATVLLIFAAASGEFALHKSVDWLFFTGKLPADPIGRMCTTLAYARQIIFMDEQGRSAAISKMNKIHGNVESKRKKRIPNWAYQDVLFMLIAYSISAYAQIKREMSAEEKEELYAVFLKLGRDMHISNLPVTFEDWEKQRHEHLKSSYVFSLHSTDLYRSYRKRLGRLRYSLLLEMQSLLLPTELRVSLPFVKSSFLSRSVCKKLLFSLLSTPLVFMFLPKQFKSVFSRF